MQNEVTTPAYSVEAEQAVIGGMLLDTNSIDDVLGVVQPEQFFKPEHNLIFSAIASIHADSGTIDPLTVAELLESRGALEESGGLIYLAELAANVPSVANIVAYAQIIKDRFMKRQMMTIGREMIAMGSGESDYTVDEMIARAGLLVEGVESGASESDSFDMIDELKKAIRSIESNFDARISDKKPDGIEVPFSDLSDLTKRLLPGQLITIAGFPGSGKTTMAMNIMENSALSDKRPHVFFSLEMTTTELLHKIISSVSGVEHDRFDSGDIEECHWPLILSAVERIKKMNLHIFDKEQLTLSYARSKLSQIQKKHGQIALVAFDYLQIMSAEIGRSRVEEIESLTSGLKGIAKKYSCPVIQLSQLIKDKDARKKAPDNSLLKGSGSIEADSDKILFTHTPTDLDGEKDLRIREVYSTKSRKGLIGMCRLAFQGQFSRFRNLSGEAFS